MKSFRFQSAPRDRSRRAVHNIPDYSECFRCSSRESTQRRRRRVIGEEDDYYMIFSVFSLAIRFYVTFVLFHFSKHPLPHNIQNFCRIFFVFRLHYACFSRVCFSIFQSIPNFTRIQNEIRRRKIRRRRRTRRNTLAGRHRRLQSSPFCDGFNFDADRVRRNPPTLDALLLSPGFEKHRGMHIESSSI